MCAIDSGRCWRILRWRSLRSGWPMGYRITLISAPRQSVLRSWPPTPAPAPPNPPSNNTGPSLLPSINARRRAYREVRHGDAQLVCRRRPGLVCAGVHTPNAPPASQSTEAPQVRRVGASLGRANIPLTSVNMRGDENPARHGLGRHQRCRRLALC